MKAHAFKHTLVDAAHDNCTRLHVHCVRAHTHARHALAHARAYQAGAGLAREEFFPRGEVVRAHALAGQGAVSARAPVGVLACELRAVSGARFCAWLGLRVHDTGSE